MSSSNVKNKLSSSRAGAGTAGAGTADAVPAPVFRRRPVQALVLCLAVFGLAAAVAFGVFEAMPHLEDEHANYFQARVFARGEIAAPAPPDEMAFYIPFVVTHNGLWFGKYTPGYPLVLALFLLLGAPWAANALASALALFGVFLLGRDLFDADAGLLAAALGAVSPAFVILSGSLLPHPLTMAALVFFAWGFMRARRPGELRAGRFSLLAGLALGLAAITRPWTALAVALPFIGVALFDFIRAVFSRRGEGRSTLRLHTILFLSCVAMIALLPLFNYAVTGSPLTNTYTLWWPYDTVGFGPGAGRAGGHTLERGLLNATNDLEAFQTAVTGWPAYFRYPLLLALLLFFGLILGPRSRYDFLILLPPVLLVAAYLAYWAAAGPFYGARYYSEGMPFLWLLAARGLLKFSAGKWRLLFVRLALPLLVLWGITNEILPRFAEGRGLYGITREGPDLIAASGIRNALVFVTVREWTDYAEFSWMISPFLDGDVVFARNLGPYISGKIISRFPGREVYYYNAYLPTNPLRKYDTILPP